MSASTRTVQGSLGTNPLGTALVAMALILIIAVALAVGQLATTKAQTLAPAAGSAPVFVDHGSRDEIGPGAALGTAPVNGNVSQYQGAVSAAAAAAAVNGNVSQYQAAVSAAADASAQAKAGAHRLRIGGQ
jgi:hypothetical protein